MQKSAVNFKADSFHCPHCKVYAKQEWYNLAKGHLSEKGVDYYEGFVPGFSLSLCLRCGNYALWLDDKMVYPGSSIAPLPATAMPMSVKEDFLEGRNVVNASPRAAGALLRLALQKLMLCLGESGKNLDNDIANLARKGLPKKIYKALEALHVIGNEAVHPGTMSAKDDMNTAIALFNLLNMMVDIMISQPKNFNEICRRIPKSKKRNKGSRKKQKKRQRKAKKWQPVLKPTILYR